MSPAEATKNSPLRAGARPQPLPRFFAVDGGVKATAAGRGHRDAQRRGLLARAARLQQPSVQGDGSKTAAPGDFSRRTWATRPTPRRIPDEKLTGISVAAYIRNMSVLIRAAGRVALTTMLAVRTLARCAIAAFALSVAAVACQRRSPRSQTAAVAPQTVWRRRSASIGLAGTRWSAVGAPRVVDQRPGAAVEFDGAA